MTDERGLVDSIQWVVLTPVLLMTILGLVQVAIWLHGRNVATDAAIAAAETAATYRAGCGGCDGQPAALARSIAEKGGLTDVDVRVDSTPGLVTATVSGRTVTFFDLGQSRIVESSTRPREEVSVP